MQELIASVEITQSQISLCQPLIHDTEGNSSYSHSDIP